MWILVMVLAVAAAAAAAGLHAERKKRHKAYLEIEMLLDSFRNPASRETALMDEMFETSSDDVDRIRRQLKRIDGMMCIMEEASRLEKEETRAVVTDIGHQLKTPVAVMKMSAELLEDETLTPEERNEFRIRFENSIEELETLVNSLLQISRMETGLIELECSKEPLENTIRKAVNCIIGKADEKHISVAMEDPDYEASRSILHDGRWLCEAIINVLDNSIKYSPNDTRIVIRVLKRNGFSRIEIEDEGIGIPKDEYNKVTTRFYRGSHSMIKNSKGSGVGLYLVNKIIKMHGGILTIKGGRGKNPEYPGTVIVMQIPR